MVQFNRKLIVANSQKLMFEKSNTINVSRVIPKRGKRQRPTSTLENIGGHLYNLRWQKFIEKGSNTGN